MVQNLKRSYEVRRDALSLLRDKGAGAFREVCRMIEPPNLVRATVAECLGITVQELTALLRRKAIAESQKRGRVYQQRAMEAEVAPHQCAELGFSLNLPSGWEAGIIPCKSPSSLPLSSTGLVAATPEVNSGLDEEHDRRALQFEELGLWVAEPSRCVDSAELEVTRYRATHSVSAIEAYRRLKLPADMLSWASRPSRGIEVDGVPGILFYAIPTEARNEQDHRVFLDAYFAEDRSLWVMSYSILSRGDGLEAIRKHKPIFLRVVRSFTRLAQHRSSR